jgi:hypothetical protein
MRHLLKPPDKSGNYKIRKYYQSPPPLAGGLTSLSFGKRETVINPFL